MYILPGRSHDVIIFVRIAYFMNLQVVIIGCNLFCFVYSFLRFVRRRTVLFVRVRVHMRLENFSKSS